MEDHDRPDIARPTNRGVDDLRVRPSGGKRGPRVATIGGTDQAIENGEARSRLLDRRREALLRQASHTGDVIAGDDVARGRGSQQQLRERDDFDPARLRA